MAQSFVNAFYAAMPRRCGASHNVWLHINEIGVLGKMNVKLSMPMLRRNQSLLDNPQPRHRGPHAWNCHSAKYY
eukprot:4854266-Amphidinium_carterae.1